MAERKVVDEILDLANRAEHLVATTVLLDVTTRQLRKAADRLREALLACGEALPGTDKAVHGALLCSGCDQPHHHAVYAGGEWWCEGCWELSVTVRAGHTSARQRLWAAIKAAPMERVLDMLEGFGLRYTPGKARQRLLQHALEDLPPWQDPATEAAVAQRIALIAGDES